MPDLLAAARDYVYTVLGIAMPEVQPWKHASELPYYLRDALDFGEIPLLGHPIVLAIARTETAQSLGEIRTWLVKVRALAGQPVVYVTGAMASFERRRLIEQKVPFIVPGNQLYLPDLGIDLREHFRQRTPAPDATLSPATQAMLIAALLRKPWQVEWQASMVADALGYTPMTTSRAVRELSAAGLADAYTMDRSRWLRMTLLPAQTWERAQPLLRTPVKRTVWVAYPDSTGHHAGRLAGMSALARHSMLAEPQWRVYAVSAAEWKVATGDGAHELPEYTPGAQQWQVWSYSPTLVPDADTVDPLSLALSLRDSTDDRVQLALDELKGQFPW